MKWADTQKRRRKKNEYISTLSVASSINKNKMLNGQTTQNLIKWINVWLFFSFFFFKAKQRKKLFWKVIYKAKRKNHFKLNYSQIKSFKRNKKSTTDNTYVRCLAIRDDVACIVLYSNIKLYLKKRKIATTKC